MKARSLKTISLALCMAFVSALAISSQAEEVPRMTKERLKEMLDNPNMGIIDVRTGMDWKASGLKIKGALRLEPKMVKEWAVDLDKGKTYVLYCA